MTEAAQELGSWPKVLSRIRERCTDQQYRSWFTRVTPSRFTRDRVDLVVPNRFLRDWLSQHYLGIIEESTRSVTGKEPRISIQVDVGPAPAAAPCEPPRAAPAPPAAPRPSLAGRGIRLNPAYTFENFVVGPSNQVPHAAALAVVSSPGTAYNPLFLHGSVGLGKTHLLQAIAHALQRNHGIRQFRHLSCESFVNDFISAIEHGKLEDFRRRYRNAEMLLVDDVQFLANKEKTQEEFFHTFNALYNSQSQIVFACDSPPGEMRAIQDRLVSRFNWGLVAHLELPDFETRVAIVRKKAHLLGADLPEEVARFLAERIDSSIRDLEGAVIRIIGYARLTERTPDLAVARDAFRHLLERRTAAISIERVLEAVLGHFAIRKSDLLSRRRLRSIAFPRQLCMFLARKHTGLSFAEIGHRLGRDHSTVLYAVDKIEEQLREDPGLRSLIHELERRLGA